MSYIYKIENTKNHKIYVGETNNIATRWAKHLFALSGNKHSSETLQRDWNDYGKEAFSFMVIEECEDSNKIERERYWITYYDSKKSGYNTGLKQEYKRGSSKDLKYNCKVSYRKLRILLIDRKQTVNFICCDIGLSTTVAKNINKDKNIGIFNLGRICLYLGVNIGDVCDILPD